MSKPWFYFGCGEYVGHHLHDESGHRAAVNVTWRKLGSFDGLLPPQDTSDGYLAVVTRLPGFGVSALAFWDYSADKRGGSNSVIFAPSMTITPEDLLAEVQRRFPWVFSRLPQAVVMHPIPSQDTDMNTVAALFVETDGCYFGLPGVDPWDKARDARLYSGPHPVVAHPPCQRWGALGVVNFARWGGLHNMPGNDGGTFATALHAVKLWGGVLEHPAKSRAFRHFGLTEPKGSGWQRCASGGWVCEVWQSAYGHRAAKATWLCYHGETPPPELRWERPEGTHQVGFQDQRGKARNKPTLSKREAAATPVEFRDALLGIARTVQPIQAAA